MEKCLNTLKHKWSNLILLVFFLSVGMLFIILAVVAYKSISSHTVPITIAILLFFMLGIVICLLNIAHYIIQSRKYSLDSQAITICYMNRVKVKYLWQDVSSIIACSIDHAPKDSSVFDYVLRIAIGEEEHGPNGNKYNKKLTLAGYETWRTYSYSLMHFKTIIILDYTSERKAMIEELSGIQILEEKTEGRFT